MNDNKLRELEAAVEFGYLQCEKGNNLERALANFYMVINGQEQEEVKETRVYNCKCTCGRSWTTTLVCDNKGSYVVALICAEDDGDRVPSHNHKVTFTQA